MVEPDSWMAAEQAHQDTDLDALVRAVAARDRAAFTTLYKATSRRLYSLCLRVMQQPELADDALSETYLQVWRQAQQFDPARGPAMAWLSVICRSRALDCLRRRGQSATLQARTAAGESEADVQTAGPVSLLAAVEQSTALHQALGQLDEQQRQLLALAYFRGYSHSELADYTGLPPGTVKSRLRRGVEKLRSLMQGDSYEQA